MVEECNIDDITYGKIIYFVTYAMVCTRSDITFVVSIVNRFMYNLGWAHWQAIKCILHYLKGSLEGVMVYCGVKWPSMLP